MHSVLLRQLTTLMLTVTLVFGGFPPLAMAELIGTETLLELQDRRQQLERVEGFLARDDVRQQLEARGVDPADARVRVAGLSDAELAQLARHMDELPAAGNVLAVLGVVLVVLIVLDILGVTNVFTRL